MELVNEFLSALLSLLPQSPFRAFFEQVQAMPYLPWLNWILPIAAMADIFRLWLVAVGLYLLYNLIMRKVGLIQ